MPGELVLESVRRSVSRWPLWELPRSLQSLVAGVVAVYCAAVCAAVALTPVQAGQRELFAVLVLCSAAAVELTRRVGEPSGMARDVYAVWDLPAAVLLPPVYALLAPIPRMALTQVRVNRTVFHRRAYTAAAVGLAYAAASLAFHAVVPGLGPGAGTGIGRGSAAVGAARRRLRIPAAGPERRAGPRGRQGIGPGDAAAARGRGA